LKPNLCLPSQCWTLRVAFLVASKCGQVLVFPIPLCQVHFQVVVLSTIKIILNPHLVTELEMLSDKVPKLNG